MRLDMHRYIAGWGMRKQILSDNAVSSSFTYYLQKCPIVTRPGGDLSSLLKTSAAICDVECALACAEAEAVHIKP